jgi:hypothetical protein
MNPVTQDLFNLLRPIAQGTNETDGCAKAIQQWQQRHHLTPDAIGPLLTQLGAQLLHAVRSKQLSPDVAGDVLSTLIIFGDTDIPPALYALQATLKLVAEHKPTTAESVTNPEQLVREHMGRMLAAMPERSQHKAEQCRYSGRFGSLRRTA